MSKNIVDIRLLVYKSLRTKALGRALAQLLVIGNKHTDKIQNLQNTYRTLLGYYIDGTEDPERTEVINYLIRETYELTDTICSDYIPVSYCEDDIYKKLFTPLLYDTEHISYASALASGTNDIEGAVAASAVTLSCINVFQEEKLTALIEFCKSPSRITKLRGITGVILTLIYHDERLSYYPAINNSLNLLFDDDENVKLAQAVVLSLLRCTETKRITDDIKESILPNISKIAPDVEKSSDETGENKAPEDKIYEIQDKLEDSGLADKMRSIAQLQQEGADINYSSFSQLKGFSFFSCIENWLMPFFKDNKNIADLFNDSADGISIVSTLLSSSTMCDSDKYSLCLNIKAVSDSLRTTLLSNLNAENEALSGIGEENESDEKAINHYIQDLYRLFKLHRDHRYYKDIFEGDMALHNLRFFRFINPNNTFLPEIASFYYSKQLNNEALDAYQKLLSSDSANLAFIKAIGNCLIRLQNYDTAIEYWTKADIIESGEESTMKRLALCYKKSGNYSEAEKLYSALLESDSENLNYLYSTAICKYMRSDFKGALNILYKMAFLQSDVKNSPEFCFYIGVCLWSEGNKKEAAGYLHHYTPLHELEKALKESPYPFTNEEINFIVDYLRLN